MTQFPRYAIYYAPAADTPLHRFGSETIGYDANLGEPIAFPSELSEVPGWTELTEAPRKYGFHGTLKAPFSLAEGSTEADLMAACAAFANRPRAIPVITPAVDIISGFVALVPSAASGTLNALAQDCVTAFDQFRKAMTAKDRARRNPAALTARQIAQLDRWGYPYVMDDFRFHMTLTGRLADQRAADIAAQLRHRFAALDLKTLRIDTISLFRQMDPASGFRNLNQFPLRAAEAKHGAGVTDNGVATV